MSCAACCGIPCILLVSGHAQVQKLEQLNLQIAAAHALFATKQAKHKSLLQQQQQQRHTPALGTAHASGAEAVRAACQDVAASSGTPSTSSNTALRLAKSFSIFDMPTATPRPLHSFQHFASICYGDLHDVMSNTTHHDQAEGTAAAPCMDKSSLQESTVCPGPRPRSCVGTSGQRRCPRHSTPIDTVSNKISVRGLTQQFMHQTAASMSVPESEVCWFIDTGLPISRTLNLAFSSSFASEECCTSVLFAFIMNAFESALQVEFGVFFLLYSTTPYLT